MVGLLLWKETEARQQAVTLREEGVLHMRCIRAELLRGPHTPESILRRRVLKGIKKLRRAGVTQLVLPEGFLAEGLPQGMEAVSTLPLRQALAADWVRCALKEQGISAAGARVAVAADKLTGEAVRTVTELTLRHRYVLLDVPRGGEDLCRRLRREYGVSIQLGPEKAQLEEAEALVLFAPRPDLTGKNPVTVPLYTEDTPLPPLTLPPALEEKLPRGTNRLQLLAALLRSGVIRVGVHLTF